MTESNSVAGERLAYQTPEIRSLGTIAEITAGGGDGGGNPWDYNNPGGNGGS
jgi:hypothetical protein